MKATELRIGNWWTNGDENYIVDINTLWDIFIAEEQGHSHLWEPIPLTEEWLLKFRFEKVVYNFGNSYFIECTPNEYKENSQMQLTVRFGERKDVDFTVNWYHFTKSGDLHTFMHIKYIHQLQNLYFALCGKELTIK